MKSKRQAWVALGLALTENPHARNDCDVHKILKTGGLLLAVREMGQKLALRRRRGKAIFSGNFPERADKQIRSCRKAGVKIVTIEDERYPSRLHRLPDPPPCLYVRGELHADERVAVALVGSRRPTPYGRRVAQGLGRELAARGIVVVSGVARGIDTIAHHGALEAGGMTLGVLGSGLDVVYPKENAGLFKAIPRSGALLTEYPFGAAPRAYHFPVRNRIIAGLSDAVIVVEAARESGSLITARLAADELGMPVGAVPGPITSATSVGCNDLIYDGATPVRDARDIVDMLPPGRIEPLGPRADQDLGPQAGPVAGELSGLEGGARGVLEALSAEEPSSADAVAESLRLASGEVLGHLLELEIRGLVIQHPGGRFLKAH